MLNLLSQLQQHLDAPRWVVAYSGGVDSHVLLHCLVELSKNHSLPTICGLHINHGLQANASQWEAHCGAICADLDISYTAVCVAVSTKEGVEQGARNSRYEAFEQFLCPSDVLLQGHHGDDQAETVLMRLLGGSGPAGLAGIPVQRDLAEGVLYRPLLSFSKNEILTYAKAKNLSWIEDDSNNDSRFDRNFLRNEIVPQLAKRWPALQRNVARSGLLSGRLAQEVSELAEQDLQLCDYQSSDSSICIVSLLNLSQSRRFSVLRYLIKTQQHSTASLAVLQALESVLLAKQDAQPVLAVGDIEFRRMKGRLFMMGKLGAIDISKTYQWSGTNSLNLGTAGTLDVEPVVGRGLRVFDSAQVSFRQGGERCKPAGRQHSQTVKKLLQEYDVPPWLRAKVPLIYIDGVLAAVGDYWVCEAFAAATDEACLQLIWRC